MEIVYKFENKIDFFSRKVRYGKKIGNSFKLMEHSVSLPNGNGTFC